MFVHLFIVSLIGTYPSSRRPLFIFFIRFEAARGSVPGQQVRADSNHLNRPVADEPQMDQVRVLLVCAKFPRKLYSESIFIREGKIVPGENSQVGFDIHLNSAHIQLSYRAALPKECCTGIPIWPLMWLSTSSNTRGNLVEHSESGVTL